MTLNDLIPLLGTEQYVYIWFSDDIIGRGSVSTFNDDIALKLSNMMNSSMLDCVTKQVITKEQVHDIESIFQKHIEENFKNIKASHGIENKYRN